VPRTCRPPGAALPAAAALCTAAVAALFAGLVLGLLSCRPAAGPDLSAERLRADVSYLASDELLGRDIGGDGIAAAEEYIAAVFADAGLEPLPGESDFFLEFPLYRRGYDSEGTFLEVRQERSGQADGAPSGAVLREALLGEDFRPLYFSGYGRWEGPLVFAGYGITAPEYGYDDYEGLDARGKVVLVLRHEPNENDPESVFAGTELTRHALFTEKAEAARRNGAVGLLVVTDPLNHAPGDDLRAEGVFSLDASLGDGGFFSDRMTGFPAIHVSRELVDSLLGEDGRLEQMQTAMDSGEKPSAWPVAWASGPIVVSVAVAVDEEVETIRCRNVAAFLEGADPELKGEIVVVGAHHDHIGAFAGNVDVIYNGADDNASGTAGVLELARAFARRGPARRSIAFVTFSAEEKGLFGSQALVDRWRPGPNGTPGGLAGEIRCMLNLDMIGRNPEEPVGVVNASAELRRLLEAADAEGARGGEGAAEGAERRGGADAPRGSLPLLPLRFRGAARGTASDADPFQRRGIPAVFMTTGLHEDYHRVTDHAELIEYERMKRILELCYRFLEAAAEEVEVNPGLSGSR